MTTAIVIQRQVDGRFFYLDAGTFRVLRLSTGVPYAFTLLDNALGFAADHGFDVVDVNWSTQQ